MLAPAGGVATLSQACCLAACCLHLSITLANLELAGIGQKQTRQNGMLKRLYCVYQTTILHTILLRLVFLTIVILMIIMLCMHGHHFAIVNKNILPESSINAIAFISHAY